MNDTIIKLLPPIIAFASFFCLNFFTKEFRNGIKKLRTIQREVERNNSLFEGDFFRGILSSKGKKGIIKEFVDALPSKSGNNERIFIKKAKKESYLIIGESGCGKSTFLLQDYLKHPFSLFSTQFPFIHLYNWLFSFSLFLSANQLINLDAEFIKSIKENNSFHYIRHYRLYLDGLDELGEQFEAKKDLIFELIKLFKNAGKCEVKIACRRKFAERNNYFKEVFEKEWFAGGYQVYEIDYWDSESLEAIAKKILGNKNLKRTLKVQATEIFNNSRKWEKRFSHFMKTNYSKVFMTTTTFDKCLINSPLLLMLFLYTNLFTLDKIDLSDSISKYDLYEKFINALGKSAGATNAELQEEKKKLSDIAFNHFVKINTSDYSRIDSSEETQLSSVNKLKKIIKEINGDDKQEISFIHYSFLDFFVAYHYQSVLCNTHLEAEDYVKVLGVDYQNEIADFITDALLVKNISNDLFLNMKNIYSSIIQKRFLDKSSVKTFLAKKEIAFRLGRLFYPARDVREKVSAFLKDMYYQDEQTYKNDKEPDLHLAMLKRWLAIAGSLLHTKDGEEIEIDYIKKMICNPYTDNIEDLANRSQTLVFYGDVIKVSALDYKDENPETPCNNSIKKRINRLLYINDKKSFKLLDKGLNPRDPELKYYCFRAFDLASIYCLLRFHGGSNSLFIEELESHEPKTKVKDIRVSFKNANPEREKIMKLLIEALSSNSLPEKIDM